MSALFAQFEQVARSQPNRIAAIGDNTLSYGSLLARAAALADQLQQRRIRSLALLADNSPAWIIIDLACMAAATVCVPLPNFFSDAQLRHALQSSGVDCILTDDPERIEKLLPALAQPHQPLEGYERYSNPYAKSVWMPANTWKVTFTSGSTGVPKGVCLSADHLGTVARSLIEVTAAIDAPRHLSVLPYATLLENIAGVYVPLLRGATVIAAAPQTLGFSGSRLENTGLLLQAMTQWQPHSLVVPPQFLQVFIGAIRAGWQIPESLAFIAVGGSKVPPAWLRQAHELGLPVFEGYGLSECASVVALNTPRHRRAGTAGRPLPHCRVAIEEGEIIVRGSHFLGYLDHPDFKVNEPLRTGDLGDIDADGFLSITGRKKNLLISSFGRNIAPEWPETALLDSGLFRHCVVFGDAKPCCVALLEPHDGVSNDAIADAVAAANRVLPDYARIANWFRPDRPLASEADLLTGNGRPRRAALEARYGKTLEKLYFNHTGVDTHGLLSKAR